MGLFDSLKKMAEDIGKNVNMNDIKDSNGGHYERFSITTESCASTQHRIPCSIQPQYADYSGKHPDLHRTG